MEFVFNVHSDFVFSVMLNGGLPAAAASSQAVGSPGSGSRANWNLVVKLENSETMTQSNVTSAASGEGATVSSAAATGGGSGAVQQSSTALNNSSAQQQPGVMKRKRNLPGMPDPDAEVIALSPKTLMATNRFVCEICNKGFQRDQNLQLHRRGHNLPWKLRQRTSKEIRKRVYICPEPSCVHHDPSRALGDLTGIKKHFCRKHGEKKWKCDKCSKRYAVQSDWKAHSKTCGTREYRCDCGTLFSRRDSFITHRAFCDALAEESARVTVNNTEPVATRTTTNSSSDDGPNPRPCPPDSNKVSISSTGGAVAPPPLSAAWGGQAPGGGGAGGGGTGSGPRLSLWLGPGPGGPGPPATLDAASASSSSQFNVMDGTGTYPYPFLMRASNNPSERSSAAAELSRPVGGGGGGFMAPASTSTLFANLLSSGSVQAAHTPPGFSELIGAMTRGGNGSMGTSTSSATSTAAPAMFSTAIPAIFSHPQPPPVHHQQQQHNNTATAQMSATALLQKAAQMGATAASNNPSLLRSFGGLAGHDNSWPPMMAAANHSSEPYPLLRRLTEGIMPMPMPMQTSMPASSSSLDQVTMRELMNSLSTPAGLGNLTGLLLQSPLLAPHMSNGNGNGNGSIGDQTVACGIIKAEELGTSMKPTTLDFLGLGGSHGRTLSHSDYAMITSMSTTGATGNEVPAPSSYTNHNSVENNRKQQHSSSPAKSWDSS